MRGPLSDLEVKIGAYRGIYVSNSMGPDRDSNPEVKPSQAQLRARYESPDGALSEIHKVGLDILRPKRT